MDKLALVMSVSSRLLVGLVGVAILIFAGITLVVSLERDTLTCDPQRCVADRERVLAFGAFIVGLRKEKAA